MLFFIFFCCELDYCVKDLWYYIINFNYSEVFDIFKLLFFSFCIYDQDCFKGEKGWEVLFVILLIDRSEQYL